jgi:hypothetical protein
VVHTKEGVQISGLFYTATVFDPRKPTEIIIKVAKVKVRKNKSTDLSLFGYHTNL